MKKTVGLMSCSGACYPALLATRATIKAMTENQGKVQNICYIEPAMSLISGDPASIDASSKNLGSYRKIVAVEGCGANCTTKLLSMYGIEPEQVHISEDLGIENRTPPFTTEEIDKLYENLDETVDFIMEVVNEITEVVDKIR